MVTKVNGKRINIHPAYKDSSGETLPSVTMILNILAKPALIHWAWDLGTKGIDYRNAFYENAYKKMWEGLKRDIKGLMKSANNYGELYLKKEELEWKPII